jgi:PAS domain S-box-containing protein
MQNTPKPAPVSMIEAERLRLFVQGVTDYAIYMLSPEGIVSSWNAGAQRFKGYAAEEIIGQHFSRFYTEEDLAAGVPARALKTALEEGKFEAEGWRVRKDGTRFRAHVLIDPIRDEAGNLLGFTKVTRDVTDRREAEQALRESEERFRLLVQGVTDYAIYMLSPSGEVTNWNAGAKRIKGYDDTEVIGTNFSRFYTEEDRAQGMPQRALHIAATEGRFEKEGWRIRKDGSRFWAHVVIDPIRNDAGELIGYAKITRDITERRAAAEELEHAKEALFQSQKLEAIGKLTGGVAHDFNNLLNVIVTGLEILDGEPQSPTSTKILASMQRATARGTALTRQLLTFARRQPLQQAKESINRVIASFESVLRRGGGTDMNFEIRLTAGLPAVMIDAAQFEAALLNLVVNAKDATPDGGSIVISTEQVELAAGELNRLPAGRYVKISVKDNGEGMPPEVAARAVEPFFTTKEVGKGTGLGLSQVYGFAQQIGGDLTIDSKVGSGTVISMYLPALPGEAGDETATASDVEKALVVDDQQDVLDVATELFRTLGYEVLAANNARDALDILARNPDVGVLFTDVVMPGMSGVELGKRVRSLMPTVKVILASGYPAPAIGSEAELAEFQFVSKPYRVSEIVKLLRMAG